MECCLYFPHPGGGRCLPGQNKKVYFLETLPSRERLWTFLFCPGRQRPPAGEENIDNNPYFPHPT